jgi:hypothetical protein
VNAAVFHPSARAELDESAVFYESRLRGLGARFGASVEEAVQRINDRPAAGTPLGGECRKQIVAGFPFSVIYRVWQDHVFVVAIAHQHRRPGYWQRRRDHR